MDNNSSEVASLRISMTVWGSCRLDNGSGEGSKRGVMSLVRSESGVPAVAPRLGLQIKSVNNAYFYR